MTAYEYKILNGANNVEKLNSLGAEGWKLVSVITSQDGMYSTAFLMREIEYPLHVDFDKSIIANTSPN